MGIGDIWNLIALQPVINILIMMTDYLFSYFGLAIIALTIIVNVCMYPLTMKQIKASQAMQSIQPKMAELQKKYGKDRQRLAQEQMQLYKESGMSPAGCLVPMLIQMPIWIALFQSIIRVLAVTPEDFLGLSRFLYSWPVVHSMVPLASKFLWLNLAEGDFVMAILVGGTMWLQQKMTTPTVADPRQQAQTRMMQWMMPLMFGYFCLLFPSGLALFWATSSVIRIAIQYYTSGWGGLVKGAAPRPVGRVSKYQRRISAVEGVPSLRADSRADSSADESTDTVEPDSEPPDSEPKEESSYGKFGDKHLDRIKHQPRKGKEHRFRGR